MTEKERVAEIVARMRKELEAKGVFKDKDRVYKADVIWHKDCVVCGQPLPKGLARVCSGVCYQKAPLPVNSQSIS